MNKKLSEKLREKGYTVGGRLLEEKYLSWILLLFRKIGIVRMVHAVLDQMESRNPTEEMLQFREIGKKNKKELQMVYNLLKDKKSREVYKDIFRYRCTKYRKYLTRHIEKDIYFNTLTMQDKEEILVDGGAFDGDTIKIFCKKSRGRYRHIYAFETEVQNRTKMEKMIRKNKISDITIEPYALWNQEEVLSVSGGGMVSKVFENGNDTVGEGKIKANSLDNLLNGKEVSFIKMDIEGAEQKALEGAKNMICKYKPKLAISIYHKPDDFYKIPLYIYSLVPQYKFYVRHYTCFYADTVLYAICE